MQPARWALSLLRGGEASWNSCYCSGRPGVSTGPEFVLAIPGSVPLSADSHLRLVSSGEEMTIEGHLHADWGGRSTRGEVFLKFEVGVKKANGTWEVVPSPMPVLHRARVGRGTLPEDLLRIELGPIQVSTSRATLRVQDGDLRIITLDDQSNATVSLQDQATSRTEIPLRVASHLVSAALDLSGAAVQFEARSFYTRVSAPYKTLLSPAR